MLALTIGGQRKRLPEGWNDAGPVVWDLLRVLARLPPPLGKLEAIRLLCGLSKREFARVSAAEKTTLLLALPWLAPVPIAAPLSPSFRHGWRTYHYPEARFADGKCLEFALADEFFQAALLPDSDVTTATTQLLATIARPRDRKGKRTILQDRDEVMTRAKRLKTLPPEHALHALMYWAGVKQDIDRLYGDYLFRGSPLDKPAAGTIPDFGWWGRFQDVAEAGVFGNLDAVNRHSFHEVCQWMLRKEAQRRSQQIENENAKLKA